MRIGSPKIGKSHPLIFEILSIRAFSFAAHSLAYRGKQCLSMKFKTRLLLILLVMLGALIAKSAFGADVTQANAKSQHLFVLKTSREYVGATIEVYYSNGDLVTSQKLSKRKMVIDFCDTKFGEYTIRVVKGDKTQEFQYVKK
jgi:hypothetical protein